MKRWLILLVLCACLTLPHLAMAQDKPLLDWKIEVILLRKTVDEQEKRIRALESLIAELMENAPTSAKSPTSTSGKSSTIKLDGWKIPTNWDRLRLGMTESQVLSILGQPTSVEELYFRTLYYRGEVPGSGLVSGKVDLNKRDDRTVRFSKPVFFK